MDNWHEIYITDKSGKRFWNTHASSWGRQSEINNLKNHLKQAKEHPEMYRFLDIETARIVVDGERLQTLDDIDLSLLDDLGL